jgi:hypothetical protein
MKTVLFAMISTALLVLLALPGAIAAQGNDPGSVVTAFDAALSAGDVEATLALFADNAVIKTQTGTFTGTTQIRGLLTQLVAQHFQFVSSNRQVNGNTETHMAKVSRDDWRKLGIAPLDATAEVVVENGKITSFNVAYTQESLAALKAAQAKAQAQALPRAGEPTVALTVLVLGALGSISLGFALRRAHANRF